MGTVLVRFWVLLPYVYAKVPLTMVRIAASSKLESSDNPT